MKPRLSPSALRTGVGSEADRVGVSSHEALNPAWRLGFPRPTHAQDPQTQGVGSGDPATDREDGGSMAL